MALIRVTAKKLAANRANARLSRGPVTAAGKDKCSRSACKHHLYARKHRLSPNSESELRNRVLPLTQDIADPIERHLKSQIAFHGLWAIQLDSLLNRLLLPCLAHSNPRLAVGQFILHHPLFPPLMRRYLWVDRRLGAAHRDLILYRRLLASRPLPSTPTNAEQSHISLIPNTRLTPTAPPPSPCSASAPTPTPACRPRRTPRA